MGLLILLVLVAMLGLIMWGAIWATNLAAARMVGDKHRLLQIIAETGEAPVPWRQPYEAKIARLRGRPEQAARLAAVERQAQEHCLRELDKLVRYVETTTLVEDEDVRRTLAQAGIPPGRVHANF